MMMTYISVRDNGLSRLICFICSLHSSLEGLCNAVMMTLYRVRDNGLSRLNFSLHIGQVKFLVKNFSGTIKARSLKLGITL